MQPLVDVPNWLVTLKNLENRDDSIQMNKSKYFDESPIKPILNATNPLF